MLTGATAKRILPWACLALWLTVQALWSLPVQIAEDWMAWRQADTQSIAENFVLHGDGILHPRVRWGGDGPGFAETEFQLYAYAASLAMRLTGIGPRPAQWISLLSMAAAAAAVYLGLKRRGGYLPGILGMGTVLASRAVVFTSSSVQPDALGFLFYVLGFWAFLDYLEAGARGRLILAAGFTALAALIKPTALSLGIFQFLAVVRLRRDLLRRPGVWVAWGVVLLAVGLLFLNGQAIRREYGNTFGIGFSGDSKFPTLRVLASPAAWVALARVSLAWGFGLPGALAAAYLLLARRLDAMAVSLGLANLALLLVAFRYTSNEWYGPHYHVVTALLAAWLVAAAVGDLTRRVRRGAARWALVAAVALLLVSWGQQLVLRRDGALIMPEQRNSVAAGRALVALAEPEDLVIVRSSAQARSELYDTVNNYEDPIVFYVGRVRGWVVPADEARVLELQDAVRARARFYVDPFGRLRTPELDAWLAGNTEFVAKVGESGGIYRIVPDPGPPAAAAGS